MLTTVTTPAGKRSVWTTFSDDQIDLNFANPDVLFELLDILMLYVSMGARIIRLDAIAYLWKRIGTPCIHLPETHEVVKLFRDFLEIVAPDVLLLTETNVPQPENYSYFGNGDEAHVVYQFALPPLLLHALQFGTSKYLTAWASALPVLPAGCAVLNFTASHDGIGVRPLQGLFPDEEIRTLVERVRALGAQVSTRRNSDGSDSPYELNITYFDAMRGNGDPDPLHVQRFLCSQTIPLVLKGIPAVYFHSLTATPNDVEGVKRTGRARSINRQKWSQGELEDALKDEKSHYRPRVPRIHATAATARPACRLPSRRRSADSESGRKRVCRRAHFSGRQRNPPRHQQLHGPTGSRADRQTRAEILRAQVAGSDSEQEPGDGRQRHPS